MQGSAYGPRSLSLADGQRLTAAAAASQNSLVRGHYVLEGSHIVTKPDMLVVGIH